MFAIRHDNQEHTSFVLTLTNLATEEIAIELRHPDLKDLIDIMADAEDYVRPVGHPLRLRLYGYGYRWLRPQRHLLG